MKKILLSATALSLALTASAFAADLPSRKAPPAYVPPPPPLTWNGFYAGLNLGGGWSSNSGRNLVSAYWDPNYPFGSSLTSAAGHAEPVLPAQQQPVGQQWRRHRRPADRLQLPVQPVDRGWRRDRLPGLEPERPGPQQLRLLSVALRWRPVPDPGRGDQRRQSGLDYIGTVRGRAGWLFTPTLLVYGTAGFAYGGVSAWNQTNIRSGWTAGGGLEWMFAPNWSAKVEYLYADLQSGGITGTFGYNYGYHFHPEINIVRAGVNYHFNWAAPAPVLAKY